MASLSLQVSGEGRALLLPIAVPLASGVFLFFMVFLCVFMWIKYKGDCENSEEQLLLPDMGRNEAATYTFVDVKKGGGERGPEICVYSFFNLLAATNDFSDDKMIGRGGFGPVYKGKLPDGQEVAIKRLSTQSAQGLREFKTEILIIARLQHKNLVRLLGCCIHREERLLIYEYMSNKSLDFFLFDPERATRLDWGKRVQIMEGIAQGLLYLHKYSRLTIIHRDLKASNILLDNEMNPKISDFGMARIFSSNQDKANTNRIVGTYGYMSPEYAMEGRFSVKSDVFSFGVLILEIVSGMKNIGSHHHFPVHGNLLGYAWELWNAGKELELVDPSMGGLWHGREASRCTYVGLMCVQERADDRPTMAEVVAILAGESVAHQVPKQPAFPSGDTTRAGSSTNSMSVSMMEGSCSSAMASGGATLFLCALVFLVSAARPARSCLEIFQASCTKPDAEPKDWVHCGGHLFRCDSYRMEIKFGGKDPTYMARKDPLDDLMLEMEDPVLSPIFADTDCDFLCSFSDSLPLFAPLPAPTPQRSSLLRSHCDKSNYSNLVSELIVGYQQYRPCSTYYLYFKSQRQHEYEEYPRLRATHRLSEPAATSPLLTWKLSMEYNTNSTMFNIVSVGFSRRGHQLDATSRFGCHMRGGSCFSPSTPSYTSCDGGMERIAIIVGLIFFGAYLTCGMLSGGWIWRKCEVDMKDCDQEQLLLREIGKNGAATYTFVDVNKGGGKRGPEICVYSFSNVLAGTDNFSDDKKLGQGGFGAVYKGKLSDGQEIAIKRLSIQSAQGLQEFKTEILIVARLQHKNLVRLLGCCIHKKERLLIYEYMPNKSLDFLLFDPERAAQLDWSKRAQIMEGIAQGLLYLHKYSRLTIIHRDLKASNILLDSEMNPKISDFGMARIFSSNEDKANTNRIVGTYGYMSPEYAMAGRFSVKSDVFSFGVLILEIVSGMKNIGSHHYFPVHGNLLGYAWELRNAGKELELVDPSLGGSWRGREVSRCVYVGLMCVQDCADDRPTMAEVVGMLAGEIPAHQVPKQPAFFPKRDAPGAGGLDPAAVCSINSMTMSTMEGR